MALKINHCVWYSKGWDYFKVSGIQIMAWKPNILKADLFLLFEYQTRGSSYLIGSTLAFVLAQIMVGKTIFPLLFLSCDLMVAVYLQIILRLWKIQNVWLSIRLNNLVAGHKTNWTKKSGIQIINVNKRKSKIFFKINFFYFRLAN